MSKPLCNLAIPEGKCERFAGHEGEHMPVEYRQIEMHPWAEVRDNFAKTVADGMYCFQSWTCVGCGAVQRMSEINGFYTEGVCENCGSVTNLKEAGCNFTVLAVFGGKPALREILKKAGFTVPREN